MAPVYRAHIKCERATCASSPRKMTRAARFNESEKTNIGAVSIFDGPMQTAARQSLEIMSAALIDPACLLHCTQKLVKRGAARAQSVAFAMWLTALVIAG